MYYNMFISLFKSFAGGERDTCCLARDIYKKQFGSLCPYARVGKLSAGLSLEPKFILLKVLSSIYDSLCRSNVKILSN